MQDEETELELPFTDEELQVSLFCVHVVGILYFCRCIAFKADTDPAFHLNAVPVPDPMVHRPSRVTF